MTLKIEKLFLKMAEDIAVVAREIITK